MKLQRTKPYYNKNHAPICIKYSLGDRCRKGDDCPYMHEGPVMIDPMEAIKTWENKMLPLEPLDDKSIRTLCVGDPRFNQQDLRDVILAHGEVETIEMGGASTGCVVVTYTTREGAEKAMKELLNKLVKGMRPRVIWLPIPQHDARPHSLRNSFKNSSDAIQHARNPYQLMRTRVKPPNDKSIRVLYVRELFGRIEEKELRDVISAADGEIESIEMEPSADCAVVTYTTREGAEKAAKELLAKRVKGMRLKVSWYIPEPIQPHPFPTTQLSNLQIQPNIPIQPEPCPRALKTSFEMSI